MKACPVCRAYAFDDAEVCYGCLYRFEWNNGKNDSGFAACAGDDVLDCVDDPFFEDPEPPSLTHFEQGDFMEARMAIPSLVDAVGESLCVTGGKVTVPSSDSLVIELRFQSESAESCLA